MNQVLQMQSQLMQGFLISENRLKKKQEELNQEVEAQVTSAKQALKNKRQKAEIKREQSIGQIQQKSEKALTSLKQYRNFAKNIREGLDKLPAIDLPKDPKKILTSTTQKLTHLKTDIQSGRLVDLETISQSVVGLIEPTRPLQEKIKIKTLNYVQQKAQEDKEIARQNEEFVLSILLMVVSAGLIVSMIWFVN